MYSTFDFARFRIRGYRLSRFGYPGNESDLILSRPDSFFTLRMLDVKVTLIICDPKTVSVSVGTKDFCFGEVGKESDFAIGNSLPI